MPSAENDSLATALCHEYHPMHWDVSYGNRNRACGACKIHAASLVASGWRVIPPGGCGICGKPLSEVGTSRCYEAHGVLPPESGADQ